jgi:hypothetical protein
MFIQLLKPFLGRQQGERIDVSEADGRSLIEQQIATPVTDDLITPAVSRALEGAFTKFTQSLDGIINASLRAFQDAQSQGRRHAVPLIFGPGGSGNPKRNFGDWCAKVATACIGRSAEALAAADALDKEYGSVPGDGFRTKASMAEASGVTGGYTVPPDFYQQLLRIVAENTFIRPRAFVQPMASATLQFPYLDVTTVQSAGVSPFFGGVQMYWTEEAQTRTETEPQFKMMELKAHELSGYSVSSNVLLADAAFGLEKFLMTLFGQAIAWFEEYSFLQGNGVGKPQGMLGAACSATVNRNAGNQVQFVETCCPCAGQVDFALGA